MTVSLKLHFVSHFVSQNDLRASFSIEGCRLNIYFLLIEPSGTILSKLMANLKQQEVTTYFCSNADWQDEEFHYDRLWRSSLYLFKLKVFKLTFTYGVVQSKLAASVFPAQWSEFGATLPSSHIMNKETFRAIMMERYKGMVCDLQKAGYAQLSDHQIELFDQSSVSEYLKSTFTLNEFVMAATRLQVL